MTAVAQDVAGFRPEHDALIHIGAKRKKPLRQLELPEWHGWKYRSEEKRIIRWIEETVVQPTGAGQGELMRIAKFQRDIIRIITESLETLISMPVGNGKTTLMSALALERICRGDDYVMVDVIATKEDQARRLIEAAMRMIECSPKLIPHFEFYSGKSVLMYRPTGSTMRAHPAKLSAIQGLDFHLALIDEIGDVPSELTTSMIARLGKQADGRVVGFGTPGTSFRDNMLESVRRQYREGTLPPGLSFIEYAATEGCAIDDQKEWRRVNPAIEAGFLSPESLPLKAASLPEHLFRAYHMGQPVETSGPWLPHGAWDDCFRSDSPSDGAQVVLALWGSYRREVALVGCSMDGAVFFGWQAEKPTDDEIAEAVRLAADQWEIVEFVHKPHIRMSLLSKLAEDGLPVEAWPADVATDVESTAALFQAISENTIAHDHDGGLAEQVGRLTAKVDRHGNPRLVESVEPAVSGALAARAAWWRAKQLVEDGALDREVAIF